MLPADKVCPIGDYARHNLRPQLYCLDINLNARCTRQQRGRRASAIVGLVIEVVVAREKIQSGGKAVMMLL